jgi:hypothetical protein
MYEVLYGACALPYTILARTSVFGRKLLSRFRFLRNSRKTAPKTVTSLTAQFARLRFWLTSPTRMRPANDLQRVARLARLFPRFARTRARVRAYAQETTREQIEPG